MPGSSESVASASTESPSSASTELSSQRSRASRPRLSRNAQRRAMQREKRRLGAATQSTSGVSKPSRKRRDLTLREKLAIVNAVKEGNRTHLAIAREHGVDRSTISKLARSEQEAKLQKAANDGLPMDTLTLRRPRFEQVNEALLTWFHAARGDDVVITEDILREKAKQFAAAAGLSPEQFKVSNGFIDSFKRRHSLTSRRMHGEAASADSATAVEVLPELQALLQTFRHVYNMDESGLFFRLLPDRTIAANAAAGFKKAKERITFAVTVSMKGDHKLPLWVIGQAANPRCFGKNGPPKTIIYRNNKKAWMTGDLFGEYLQWFDNQMVRRLPNEPEESVLLLVDNCSAHILPNPSKFKRLKVHFLPPNTTSRLQPADAGIIKCIKSYYKRELLRKAVRAYDNSKLPGATPVTIQGFIRSITLSTAIAELVAAWQMVSASTIANCWRTTGLTSFSSAPSSAGPSSAVESTADEAAEHIEAEIDHLINAVGTRFDMASRCSASEFIEDADAGSGHENADDVEARLIAMLGGRDQAPAAEDEEEDEEELPEISAAQLRAAAADLRSAFSVLARVGGGAQGHLGALLQTAAHLDQEASRRMVQPTLHQMIRRT